MNVCFTFLSLLIVASSIFAQNTDTYTPIPMDLFVDGAHHWYDIHDNQHIIDPDSQQQQYELSDIVHIADNILLFQNTNGGWPKNHDMTAILTDRQKNILRTHKDDRHSSFDNGATYPHVAYLASAYKQTGYERYRQACIRGLQYMLSAQYKNGGFPQFFPDTSGYQKYITYNDGAMIGIMNVFLDIIQKKPMYAFIKRNFYNKVLSAWQSGINCILKTQIVQDGEPTVWCQQHDELTLQPRNARAFEPAALCNGESSGIVLHLMRIKNPSKQAAIAIRYAVEWFNKAALHNIRVISIDAPFEKFQFRTSTTDKVLVADTTAPVLWPRFNELSTGRPLFCNRDAKIVYSLAEVERERRTGYAWYIYTPQLVLDSYDAWDKKHRIHQ